MSVSVTHTQVNSVLTGPLYQVIDTVTATTGIDTNVFILSVVDDSFQYVASVADMYAFPNTKAAAITANQTLYRSAVGTMAFAAISNAVNFAATNVERIEWLVNAYNTATNAFIGTTTATITSTT